MIRRQRFFIGLFVLLLSAMVSMVSTKVFAQSTSIFLIINQVRGSECCGAGGVAELINQIDWSVENELPTYFAVRYDVLINDEYVAPITAAVADHAELIKPALLVEITPALAAESGVEYTGDPEQWYRASQVFPIGYEPLDRHALIDTLMKRYFEVFGAYPELTAGWMIDTDSLNYMTEKYGVQVHQITREQWGVDSYSLYGGPAHHPYLASQNWAFMPGSVATPSALIVRQTVTDPLLNYGDLTSAFTSQPNDYARDGKNLEYFKGLIAQTWNEENSPGFIVLGLENSMPDVIQQDFQQQLKWLKQYSNEKAAQAASVSSLVATYTHPEVLIHSGTDVTRTMPDTKAWWITTPRYRVRLLQQADTLWLTDLRVYDESLKDQYSDKSARHQGYWIAPAILDSSLGEQKSVKPWWQWWRPPEVNLGVLKPVSDTVPSTKKIKLATLSDRTLLTMQMVSDSRELSYMTKDGVQEKVIFNLDTFVWESSDERLGAVKKSLEMDMPSSDVLALKLENKEKQLWATPTIATEKWPQLQADFPNQYFPEVPLVDSPDQQHSIVYPNNRYTLAGVTPIRVVFAPKDAQGTPVGLKQPLSVSFDQATATLLSENTSTVEEPLQFIDFDYPQPGSVIVSMRSGAFVWSTKVYFAPDCRKEIAQCVSHPQQASWYLMAKINDWLREK